jgi:hypothetical protein
VTRPDDRVSGPSGPLETHLASGLPRPPRPAPARCRAVLPLPRPRLRLWAPQCAHPPDRAQSKGTDSPGRGRVICRRQDVFGRSLRAPTTRWRQKRRRQSYGRSCLTPRSRRLRNVKPPWSGTAWRRDFGVRGHAAWSRPARSASLSPRRPGSLRGAPQVDTGCATLPPPRGRAAGIDQRCTRAPELSAGARSS